MRLYSTLSRRVEELELTDASIKMYLCGTTPYEQSHVGHAMSAIVFDVLRRYLEFRGHLVFHLQNFTDIDDKIIERSRRLGIPPADLAERYAGEYLADLERLNVLRATRYVRATEEIDQIIEIISDLVGKGFAYAIEGDVYFRVGQDSDYGKLSRHTGEELLAGARIDVDERKENATDFALWKATKAGEPAWESPWGQGRPGWHIECSAIVLRHLGPQIDIHGGGQDLIFPHHENEIAQSESHTGRVPFARFWVHNGLVQMGDTKMSKSLGNFVTIREALEQYSADALRLAVLTSHYRSPMSYSDESMQAAERGIKRLLQALEGHSADVDQVPDKLAKVAADARGRFIGAMDDDLNTSAALAQLFELAREINRARAGGATAGGLLPVQNELRALASVLGLRLQHESTDLEARPFVDLLLSVRTELRHAKMWQLSDRIRDELSRLNVVVKDRPDGSTWRPS